MMLWNTFECIMVHRITSKLFVIILILFFYKPYMIDKKDLNYKRKVCYFLSRSKFFVTRVLFMRLKADGRKLILSSSAVNML